MWTFDPPDAPDLPIPILEDVRKDAAEAPNIRSQVPEDDLSPLLKVLPECLEDRLPSLFGFSARAPLDTVPQDLALECAWALEILMNRCTQDSNRSNDIITHHTMKLATLCMRPDVEDPDCVVRVMKSLFDCYLCTNSSWDMSALPSKIRLMYAVALVKTAADDDEAERILIGVLDTEDPVELFAVMRITAQLYLSRVLRRKGHVQDASAMENELVRWFKKNPHIFFDEDLASLFLARHNTDQPDPVLVALGGPSWLQHRKRTAKTELRRTKSCAQCDADDLGVNLKKCGACENIWYCSTKCQKTNWPFHKDGCKITQELKKKLGRTEQEGNARQNLCRDLVSWSDMDATTRPYIVAHALGIHRDATRGRTHILFRLVERNPTADWAPRTFITIACGVFRLEDAISSFEKALKLGKGKGRQHFRKQLLRYESGAASHMVPLIELVSCPQGPLVILCKGISLAEIKQFPYDPDWKGSINPKGEQVPKTLPRWGNAKNAEHD